jgi:hypothetical protein
MVTIKIVARIECDSLTVEGIMLWVGSLMGKWQESCLAKIPALTRVVSSSGMSPCRGLLCLRSPRLRDALRKALRETRKALDRSGERSEQQPSDSSPCPFCFPLQRTKQSGVGCLGCPAPYRLPLASNECPSGRSLRSVPDSRTESSAVGAAQAKPTAFDRLGASIVSRLPARSEALSAAAADFRSALCHFPCSLAPQDAPREEKTGELEGISILPLKTACTAVITPKTPHPPVPCPRIVPPLPSQLQTSATYETAAGQSARQIRVAVFALGLVPVCHHQVEVGAQAQGV